MITTRALTKRYGAVMAVSSVDIDVREGDRYGLLGPNGSGKTTLVRMLLGLVFATSGEIEVMGSRIPKHANRILRDVGALVEGPAAYPNLSGRANLKLLDAAGPRGDRRTRRRRIDDALEQVGMAGIDRRPVKTYSLGMRQRLGLAAALVRRPRLLILDEPGNGLDPHGIRDTRQLLLDLSRGGVTIFLSSHLLAQVEQLCTRVGILDRGRLVTEGPMEALLEQHAQPIFELDPDPAQVGAVAGLVAALRAATWVRDVREEQGVLRVVVADASTASKAILPLVGRADVSLSRLERVKPSLEDVFVRVVGADRLDGQLTEGPTQ